MSALPVAVAAPPARPASTRRSPVALLGWSGCAAAVVVAVVLVVVVFAPWLAPLDPDRIDLVDTYAAPSTAHWLGTDAIGRDVASRLIVGSTTSIAGPALIVLLALVISVPLALVAAWSGGWVAFVVNRVVDVLFSIPGLLLGILAAAVFGPGLSSAVAALAIAYVPYVARIAITAAEQQRRLSYVQVLTVQGVAAPRIMVRHVLRNIGPLLAGQSITTFAYALIDLAALSFLGLGVQAPAADWGVLVSDRDTLLQGRPLPVVVAAVAIVATVLALFVLGGRISGESPARLRTSLRRSSSRSSGRPSGRRRA